MKTDNNFEWNFGDDHEFHHPPASATPGRPRLRFAWLPRLLLALAGLALLSTVILWRVATVRHERLVADAQAAVDLELAALVNGEAAISAWDEQADRLWQTRYVNYVRNWVRLTRPKAPMSRVVSADLVPPNLALVMVNTTYQQGDASRTVSEARVYRLEDRRWLRTSVDDRVWGSWEVLETSHFRFVYHQRDAAMVKEVAQGADVFFERVYIDLGVPIPTRTRMTITLDIASPTMDAVRTDEGIRITSPLVTFTGLDASETAAQSVRWRLASTFVNIVALESDYNQVNTWRSLIAAMYGAESSLFAPYPTQWRQQAYDRLRQAQTDGSLLPLPRLEASTADQSLVSAQYTALADFTVARFGPAGPARILNATRQATTWEDVSRTGFLMNATELEAAWRAWLKEKLKTKD